MHDLVNKTTDSKINNNQVIGNKLSEEQMKSQISSGHRLINLVRNKKFGLYSEKDFLSNAIHIPPNYIINNLIPSFTHGMNETISSRVNAAISRARKNASEYSVKTCGLYEFIAEELFNNWWYKPNTSNFSRVLARDKVKSLIENNKKIRMYIPILSRKPLNPVKNRGNYPDIAEIHTLVRFAEAAQVINTLSPTGAEIVIMSDGQKYKRACGTPNNIVDSYQSSLIYWIELLEIGDVVRLENYENWVLSGIGNNDFNHRENNYHSTTDKLHHQYSTFFAAENLDRSIEYISSLSNVGKQLSFTFNSILSSLSYQSFNSMFSKNSEHRSDLNIYSDEGQKLYLLYLSSLHRDLSENNIRGVNFDNYGYLSPSEVSNLFCNMRKEAWEAAIRYVSISLTDRDLNINNRIEPDSIKLTIHPKKNELHFITATRKDANMTAQHCVGGFEKTSTGHRVNFKYRLNRECNNELPVIIETISNNEHNVNKYGPLLPMSKQNQPLFYIDKDNQLNNLSKQFYINRKG